MSEMYCFQKGAMPPISGALTLQYHPYLGLHPGGGPWFPNARRARPGIGRAAPARPE